MEIRGKNRQSTYDIKRQALEYVYEARGLAYANKVKSSLKRINIIEKSIQKAKIDRRRPNDFCKKEIEELQIILSDLSRQEAKWQRQNKWQMLLPTGIFKLFVFLGCYLSSIPRDAFKVNWSFYISLGLIIYLCLFIFLLIYYRAFMTFFYKALDWARTFPEKEAKFLRFTITFCIMALGI